MKKIKEIQSAIKQLVDQAKKDNTGLIVISVENAEAILEYLWILQDLHDE